MPSNWTPDEIQRLLSSLVGYDNPYLTEHSAYLRVRLTKHNKSKSSLLWKEIEDEADKLKTEKGNIDEYKRKKAAGEWTP